MSKQTTAANTDNRSLIMKDLTRCIGSDDGGNECELDDESLHKELVKWAGRLELESIDLRDKSTGLIGELSKNGHILVSTSDKLSKEFAAFKKSNSGDLKQVVGSVERTLSSLKSIEKTLQKYSRSLEQSERLNMSKSPHNSNNGSFVGQVQFNNLNRKVLSIHNAVNILKADKLESIRHQQQNQMSFDSLNTALGTCLRKLDGLYNLQIDFNKGLQSIIKSQESLKSELETTKSYQTQGSTGSSDIPYLSPNSSYSDSISVPTPQTIVLKKKGKSISQNTITKPSPENHSNNGSSSSFSQRQPLRRTSPRQLLRLQKQATFTSSQPNLTTSTRNLRNFNATVSSSDTQFVSLLSDDTIMSDL